MFGHMFLVQLLGSLENHIKKATWTKTGYIHLYVPIFLRGGGEPGSPFLGASHSGHPPVFVMFKAGTYGKLTKHTPPNGWPKIVTLRSMSYLFPYEPSRNFHDWNLKDPIQWSKCLFQLEDFWSVHLSEWQTAWLNHPHFNPSFSSAIPDFFLGLFFVFFLPKTPVRYGRNQHQPKAAKIT